MKSAETDEAFVVSFNPSGGDIERQIAARLRQHPGYEVRYRRTTRHGEEVAFVHHTNRGSVFELPDGDLGLPMSERGRHRFIRQFMDYERRTSKQPSRALRWVESCIEHGEATADPASRALFWLHLWSLLTDLRSWCFVLRKCYEEGERHPQHDPTDAIVATDEALTMVCEALSDEDVLFVTYYRHHVAHFEVHAFSFYEPGKVRPLEREPTEAELDKLSQADESEVARCIAEKVLDPLRALVGPLKAWSDLAF
jgi:hypothetical protein